MSDTSSNASVEGTIEAKLPRGLFKVRLEDGRRITAAVSTQAKRISVGFVPGDQVLIGISQFDPTRGRIEQKI